MKEIQIKTTMKNHFTYTSLAKFKSLTLLNTVKDVE